MRGKPELSSLVVVDIDRELLAFAAGSLTARIEAIAGLRTSIYVSVIYSDNSMRIMVMGH